MDAGRAFTFYASVKNNTALDSDNIDAELLIASYNLTTPIDFDYCMAYGTATLMLAAKALNAEDYGKTKKYTTYAEKFFLCISENPLKKYATEIIAHNKKLTHLKPTLLDRILGKIFWFLFFWLFVIAIIMLTALMTVTVLSLCLEVSVNFTKFLSLFETPYCLIPLISIGVITLIAIFKNYQNGIRRLIEDLRFYLTGPLFSNRSEKMQQIVDLREMREAHYSLTRENEGRWRNFTQQPESNVLLSQRQEHSASVDGVEVEMQSPLSL